MARSRKRRLLSGVGVRLAIAVSVGVVAAGLLALTVAAAGTRADASSSTTTATTASATTTTATAMTPAAAVVAFNNGDCALLKSGGVECWGYDPWGELGDGASGSGTYSDVPVPVKGLSGVVSLVSYGVGYCAVLASRTVDCWGYSNGPYPGGTPGEAAGLLGNGSSETQSDVPVAVRGLTGVKSLIAVRTGYGAAGAICALLASGGVKCWGSDSATMGGGNTGTGLLGDGGSAASSSVPVAVKGLTGTVVSLASAQAGVCALLASGGAECWGDNNYDELGDGKLGDLGGGGGPGTQTASNVAVPVKGLSGAKSIVSDGYGFCALLRSGGAACWGNDSFGELGDGLKASATANYGSDVAVRVQGLGGAVSLASTDYAFCALLASGSAKCWGYNSGDQLGDGFSSTAQAYSDVPVAVKGLSGAAALIGGGANGDTPSDYTYCAILRSGGVDCWGQNAYGFLGDGNTTASFSDTAGPVSDLTGVASLEVGIINVCAVLRSGGADCWGFNADGALGSGSTSTADSYTPVAVSGLG